MVWRMRSRFVVIAWTFLGAGMSAASGQSVSASVDTRGPFPVVRVTGEPPRWRIDSLATLSDSGVGFRRLNAVLIDPRGGVLLADPSAPAIYRFDDTGALKGILGRKGSGPKEYLAPYAIGWAGDDLMVYDAGNSRVMRWSRAGEWLEQWTSRSVTGTDVAMFSAGPSHVWLRSVASKTPTPGGGRAAGSSVESAFIRYPLTGAGDTVRLPNRTPFVGTDAAGPRQGKTGIECRHEKSISIFSSPFEQYGSYYMRPLPSGSFATLASRDYRVALIPFSGSSGRALEHAVPRVAVTDAEWATATAEYREFKEKHPVVLCSGELERPAAKPATTALVIDDRGRIWVERTLARGSQWEVWDGDALIGSVPGMPHTGEPGAIDIRGDRMAVARESEDGGTVVVVYRIRK